MQVVIKRPGEAPAVMDIPNTLEALQEAVGGYIETVTVAEDLCLICNEDGRLLRLEPNCTILGVDFVGPVLAVGVRGDDFTGISDEYIPLIIQMMQ